MHNAKCIHYANTRKQHANFYLAGLTETSWHMTDRSADRDELLRDTRARLRVLVAIVDDALIACRLVTT